MNSKQARDQGSFENLVELSSCACKIRSNRDQSLFPQQQPHKWNQFPSTTILTPNKIHATWRHSLDHLLQTIENKARQ